MLKQYYEKLLPAQGVYCVVGIINDTPIQKFVSTIPDVLATIDELKGTYNVFVAPNSFQGPNRKANEALYAKSFFIDLDVGGDSKKYPDQSTAIADLNAFVLYAELPPPCVINSGTGVHAYWILDQDIPSQVWYPYANRFKQYCLEHLKIDPTVTADRARIMRAPDTFNYKTNPPSPTGFWPGTIIQEYSFDVFKDFLGGEIVDVLAGVEKGVDDSFKIHDENIESVFQIIAEKSIQGNGCAQIRCVLENAKTLSEPLWHSGLSIARHCSDWETAIYKMSEDYPDYTPEKTLKKANETLNKPHSCLVFEDRNPGVCNGCTYRGKITNPLALGRHLKEDSPQNPIRLLTNTQAIPPPFPKELFPFTRGAGGGVYFKPLPVTDKKGNVTQDDPIQISRYDIYPTKRIYNANEGACLEWRYVLPKDPMRQFQVPTKLINSKDEMMKIFSEQELALSSSKVPFFMEYIVKWSQHLLNMDAAEQMRTQMGWTEDGDGFVIGNMELRRDGSVLRAASSPLVRSVAKLIRSEGSYEHWKDAAKEFNRKSMEIHAFGFLCGFGSPLMRFTSTKGVTIGFTGETGSGKTGSLYSAISLFGDPAELGMTGGKDQATANSLIGMYLALKNIMLGLDESTNRTAQELSNLIYQISHGKGKMRMRSDKNALREHELSASLIAFMTQNQSPEDKLKLMKDSPDGELARYIDFTVNMPQAMMDDPWLGKKIFNVTRLNFGWAGPDYVQELFRMGDDAVTRSIEKWIQRFENDFGKNSSYRYYENLMGVVFAGGEIAYNRGIVKLDLDRIYKEVLKQITAVKVSNKINDVDYMSILGEFQNTFHNGTLYIDKNSRVIREPKGPLVARAETDSKTYDVALREMKIYLTQRQINVRGFMTHMRDNGIMIFEGKKRLSKGWSGMSNVNPVSVLTFKYEFDKEKLGGDATGT